MEIQGHCSKSLNVHLEGGKGVGQGENVCVCVCGALVGVFVRVCVYNTVLSRYPGLILHIG